MDLSRNSCRLCLSESDFNVSLFGNYSRKSHIVEKVLVCLKVVVEDTDPLTTICYRCAGNVERYYDFITVVKKSQNRLNFSKSNDRHLGLLDESFKRRHVTYVREQVVDADYTISFLDNLDMPLEKKEKFSSPLFSYVSPPKTLAKEETDVWKTPRQVSQDKKFVRDDRFGKKKTQRRNCSRDLFETESQEEEQKGFDWKLTPDDNIIKRVREKLLGWTKS